MKVSQLAKKLQKLPQNAEVFLIDDPIDEVAYYETQNVVSILPTPEGNEYKIQSSKINTKEFRLTFGEAMINLGKEKKISEEDLKKIKKLVRKHLNKTSKISHQDWAEHRKTMSRMRRSNGNIYVFA